VCCCGAPQERPASVPCFPLLPPEMVLYGLSGVLYGASAGSLRKGVTATTTSSPPSRLPLGSQGNRGSPPAVLAEVLRFL
jgi:hypothetical protein